MNHYASKVVVVAQDNLMKARDERVALMNEVRLIFVTCHYLISLKKDLLKIGLGRDSHAQGMLG